MDNKNFECDQKEFCCKNGLECGGCLYGVVYQLAMKYEQEKDQKRSIKNDVD